MSTLNYRYVILDTPSNQARYPEYVGKVVDTENLPKKADQQALRDLVSEVLDYLMINEKEGALSYNKIFFEAKEKWNVPDNIMNSIGQSYATCHAKDIAYSTTKKIEKLYTFKN